MTAARPCVVNFGSAQLLVDRMPPAHARRLLEVAIGAGATRLDTAPLYGHGGSEALVGEVASRFPDLLVTTKVGLEPTPAPSRARAFAGALRRRLPPAVLGSVRSALGRGGPASQADGPSGRFGIGAVKASIERSLSRLGAVDRLLLHEVHPADITDELLDLLAGYRRRGDVNMLGVATGNAVTAEALRRSHGLFGVAHVSIDPLGSDPLGIHPLAGPSHAGHSRGTDPLADRRPASEAPDVGPPPVDADRRPASAAPDGGPPPVDPQAGTRLLDIDARHPPVQCVGHGALGTGGRTLVHLRRRLDRDAEFASRWKTAVAGTPFHDRDGLAAALLARAAECGPGELLVASRSAVRVPISVLAASGALGLPTAVGVLLNAALARPAG